MGVVLEAVGTSRGPAGGSASSVALAIEAADVALGRAGAGIRDVGLIINVGVFRDENICEPAMAPFVQRDLERRLGLGSEILSFDLADGACGMLTAARVASGFIESGAVERALVVASDVDSTATVSDGWAFDPVGGAMVLGRGAPQEGFVAFHAESFAKHSDRFEAHVEFIGNAADRPSHALRVRQGDDFDAICGRCAAAALVRFSESADFERSALDLVVPSASPEGFASALSASLAEAAWSPSGRASDRAPLVWARQNVRPHTAGPAFALEGVIETERFREATDIAFVGAGAGVSVAIARYRKERGA
jgi:3-oxoacyl-[acyl-carrier-protein] synthase-3